MINTVRYMKEINNMALELQILQEQLGQKKGKLITQEIVDELNMLEEDPDYSI